MKKVSTHLEIICQNINRSEEHGGKCYIIMHMAYGIQNKPKNNKEQQQRNRSAFAPYRYSKIVYER